MAEMTDPPSSSLHPPGEPQDHQDPMTLNNPSMSLPASPRPSRRSWGGTTVASPTYQENFASASGGSPTAIASSPRLSTSSQHVPFSIGEPAFSSGWDGRADVPPGGSRGGGGGGGGGGGVEEEYPEEKPLGNGRAVGFRGLWTKGGLLRPGRLLWQDLHNLPRRYKSDWTTFNQLVFASAVYIFFTNLLPGITFANDLYVLTGRTWGTIEVVFSTGLCGAIFALFSSQPLTVLGVTGPFSVLAETMYTLCTTSFNIPFLPFMAWSLIHAFWLHILLAVFNAHDWTMLYVTTFSTEIFSLLNSVIYFHKAIQVLQRLKDTASLASFLYGVIGAAGTFLLAVTLSSAESWSPIFHRIFRMGLREYAAAISIVLWIGIPNIGELARLDKEQLATSTSFTPSDPSRSQFFVRFWELPAPWIGAAIVPGVIITMLFFFDHEVSSIICTGKRYGIRKPGGFAWDIALLGMTTAMCGILGIPPANGLLPQAPLHSESLMYVEKPSERTAEEYDGDGEQVVAQPQNRVYEQRWSQILQSGGILLFLAPPMMHVLGLTPTSVLAGLFLFMGEQSLQVNPILRRFLYIFSDPAELTSHAPWHEEEDDDTAGLSPPRSPVPACDLCARQVDHKQHHRLPLPPSASSLPQHRKPSSLSLYRRWLPVHLYTLTQVAITGGIFAVTLTVAAPSFPLIIILLVPIRLMLMDKLWSRAVLRRVDAWACREGTPEEDEDRARAAHDGLADERLESLEMAEMSEGGSGGRRFESEGGDVAVRSRAVGTTRRARMGAKARWQSTLAKRFGGSTASASNDGHEV